MRYIHHNLLLQGIFQPRDWTQVSHIAGGFFTVWATREAHNSWLIFKNIFIHVYKYHLVYFVD